LYGLDSVKASLADEARMACFARRRYKARTTAARNGIEIPALANDRR
jgi:hypothetical protein